MEQVTPNVFTNTKLRGCNPSFVTTSDWRGRDRHAAAADEGGRDAEGGRVARPDPLHHQHRAPRRPHLRQLLLQGRRDGRQPPGPVRPVHGRLPGARPLRLRLRVRARTDGAGHRPRRSRGRGALARPRGVLPRPEQGQRSSSPATSRSGSATTPSTACTPPATRPASSRSTCPRSASSSPATRSSPGARRGS